VVVLVPCGRMVNIVSLIGSLEQLDLANILRRIEIFAKTGLLVVKHQDVWVEFYFRQGQLVCVGPMTANTTLIDRLLQAQILSFQTLPQVMSVINADEPNETRIALALINEGYLSREILRAWSAHETSQVLQRLSTWTTGEIYFEDEQATPADRLLVALSISTLLDTLPTTTPLTPIALNTSTMNMPAPPQSRTTSVPNTPVTSAFSSGVHTQQFEATQLIETPPAPTSFSPKTYQTASATPGSFNAAQLIDVVPAFAAQPFANEVEGAGMINLSHLLEDDLPFGAAPVSEQTSQAMSMFGAELNISASTQSSLIPPQPVPNPMPPARIDTSFMTPSLVLTPVDLSSLREQNPQVQVTPDQWSLFALIDGQTSLQALCSALMAPVEQVCTVAGELMAIGLVMPLLQAGSGFTEFAPPQSAMPQAQRALTWAPPPQPSMPAPMPVAVPMTTQAQWGNGDTGATFTMGSGWIISSKPTVAQPSPVYVPAGGHR
jgi:uncharacterized protein DUF4388